MDAFAPLTRTGGTMTRTSITIWFAALAILATTLPARADEGMWTFDNLPLEQMRASYGFTPSPEWIAHVQGACVRFNDGGSGSFVSPNGLVLTNHHVALGQLQKVSTAGKDYVKEGFFARTPGEEMPCPDLELNQLVSMENVTARVLAAIDPRAPEKRQNEQRKGAVARIEKESTDRTKLRSDVVELYQGGEYWLYRYQKYTDIRLVMAVEQQTAFYGGDPDNFTYPRYDLDIALFRVYEKGQPVRPKEFLRWSEAGAGDGELVFVAGHPGDTSRSKTVAQLEYIRDTEQPASLEKLRRGLATLRAYAAGGPEPARRAAARIFGIENTIKARIGYGQAFQDPRLMREKTEREAELRAFVAADPALAAECGASWDRIAAAQRERAPRLNQSLYRGQNEAGRFPEIATPIVRYVAEVAKPNDKRLEEFRDSNLESLRFDLFSPAPIYADLEEALLAAQLSESLEKLGPDDPWAKAALGDRSPALVAHELIAGTKLGDPEVRRRLIKGGRAAVAKSTDPFIVWARATDPAYREYRVWFEDNIQSVESLEGNRIAKARFAHYGKSLYPDATFTLRLSYGKVAGYELGTTRIPYKTTYYGLYDRAAGFDDQWPFSLTPAVDRARGAIYMATPLNFVTTNDIIGGNSGSPVLNRAGEFVGIIVDGNIQSLIEDFAYDEEVARAVAVHSSGILEGLRRIYDMGALADELTGAGR
jgi:hypothetical protein